MATMTIRLPDAKHQRLRRLAERHGISLNKLVDDWASIALAEFDAETRFRAGLHGAILLGVWPCWTNLIARWQRNRPAK